MNVYAVLTISYDDDYKNTTDSYNVEVFKNDEERLKYLCTDWFENSLANYMIDQCNDEKDLNKLKKNKLLKLEMKNEETIKEIKIYSKKYSYKTLDKLLETYGRGNYVNFKFGYVLYEFTL